MQHPLYPNKDPFDKSEFSFDFTGILRANDTLANCINVIFYPSDDSITSSNTICIGNTVSTVLTGGTSGIEYFCGFQVTTNFGDRFQRSALLPVANAIGY